MRQALTPQTLYSMSSIVAGEEGPGRADVDSLLPAQGGPPHCHHHQGSESQGHGHHRIFWQVPWKMTILTINSFDTLY